MIIPLKKLNQKGALDIMLIAAIGMVIVVGGFAMHRITSANELGSSATRRDESQGAPEKENIDATSELNEAKPADEVELQDLSTDADGSDTLPQTGVATFTKGGQSVGGSSVQISSIATENLSGTCSYTFNLGNSTFTRYSEVSADRNCAIDIPISDFSKSGTWSYTLVYQSYDGLVQGSSGPGTIDIVPKEIFFTKGGGNYSGGVMSVALTTPENQTGTCTYTFTLGNSKVETSNSISNSRTCRADFSNPAFPKSGNWLFELSFVSSDSFTVGSGGGFELEVN